MKRLDGRPAVFFIVFMVAHSASATDLGRCPGTGKDLEDKLWTARSALLGARAEAASAAAKPSAWNTALVDRLSLELSYGNTSTVTLREDDRSYEFRQGDSKLSGSIKYTLPFSVFSRPSTGAQWASKEVQDFERNEQRVAFYDLLHDLRVALAEVDVAKQNKGPSSAEAALADVKANKIAARLRHMTEDKIYFEPECIK